MTIQTISQHL